MRRYKVVCTLHFGDVFVQTVAWVVLSVITLGVALPFFAYYFVRLILNRIEIHEVAG
jgi:uncharacterized membrane protein YjgN (DUF898 family)